MHPNPLTAPGHLEAASGFFSPVHIPPFEVSCASCEVDAHTPHHWVDDDVEVYRDSPHRLPAQGDMQHRLHPLVGVDPVLIAPVLAGVLDVDAPLVERDKALQKRLPLQLVLLKPRRCSFLALFLLMLSARL